jgi:aryl-alcohol dehydrogenase-like predicted oxidoreductase
VAEKVRGITGGAALGVGTAMFVPGYGLAAGPWSPPGPAMLRTAVERGVGYLDTAASYGESEAALGEIHDAIEARQVRICTKLDVALMAGDLAALESGLQASLTRLRLSRVDTLLAHSADASTLSAPSLTRGWGALKQAGLVDRTGASTYGVDDALVALALDGCDVVQVEFSILNQQVLRAVSHRKAAGQELVARSVLCKGLLTGRRAGAPVAQTVSPTIDALERLADEWSYALPELAIRFAIDSPGVDVVLVGVASLEELDTALRAAARPPLEAGQMEALREFDRSDVDAVHPERWGRIAVQ